MGLPSYQLVSSIQMYMNAIVLGYIVLYVEPVEKALHVFERLRRSFDDMMKYVGEGIALLDRYGRVISCNSSLVDILERPETEIVITYEITGDIHVHDLKPTERMSSSSSEPTMRLSLTVRSWTRSDQSRLLSSREDDRHEQH